MRTMTRLFASLALLFFACGFVRVGEESGRWWFRTDAGERLILSGVGGVSPSGSPSALTGGHPYARNLEAQGVGRDAWGARAQARLHDWGFNFLTISYPCPTFDFLYAKTLALGRDASRVSPNASVIPFKSVHEAVFPNVFEPAFEAECRRLARERCAPERENRLLVGYFIDNELNWIGSLHRDGLFGLIAQLPDTHSAKIAQRKFLAERGWTGRSDEEVRTAFLALIAERYFAITTAAIREADPNHLVMGCRFAGFKSAPDALVAACGRHCDVLSVNVYPAADLDRNYVRVRQPRSAASIVRDFDRVWEKGRKPVMVTEWSFPGLDAGLPSLVGAGQRCRTQADRAAATELCARVMCGLPYVVGFVHFGWTDQSPTGIPEDCNYGLVNSMDEPYEELVGAFRRIHGHLEDWHRAGVPARTAKPANDVAKKALGLGRAGRHPGTFVRRKDGSFVAENGAFALEGRMGEPGLTCAAGTFRPLVHHVQEGRKDWTLVERLVDVKGGVEAGVLTVDCTFEGGVRDSARFRLKTRLYLPADRAVFLYEPRELTNAGNAPTEVAAVYGLFVPPEGEGAYVPGFSSQDRTIENLWDAWNYGAWIDPKARRYLGAIGSTRDQTRIHFWQEGQAYHSDASIAFLDPVSVKPGASVGWEERPYLLFTFGRGGAYGWRQRLLELGVRD